MSLLYLACLPVALTQGVPGGQQGGVVLDGSGEVVLGLLAVVREDVEGPALQTPILHLRNIICREFNNEVAKVQAD